MGLEAAMQITVIRIGEKKTYKLAFVTHNSFVWFH